MNSHVVFSRHQLLIDLTHVNKGHISNISNQACITWCRNRVHVLPVTAVTLLLKGLHHPSGAILGHGSMGKVYLTPGKSSGSEHASLWLACLLSHLLIQGRPIWLWKTISISVPGLIMERESCMAAMATVLGDHRPVALGKRASCFSCCLSSARHKCPSSGKATCPIICAWPVAHNAYQLRHILCMAEWWIVDDFMVPAVNFRKKIITSRWWSHYESSQ